MLVGAVRELLLVDSLTLSETERQVSAEVPAQFLGTPEAEEALAQSILRWLAPARQPQREPPRHEVAERALWPWLPTLEHHHLAQHPYCAHCGGVKYVGSLRAIPLGGLLNLATRLRGALTADRRKVTEAQFRLIVRRLQAAGADDTFLQSRLTQQHLLVNSFHDITGLDEPTLLSYLRSC